MLHINLALIGQAVPEEKMFEIVDGRTTNDGRTPDHGHPISSPCEPNGSDELKMRKPAELLHPKTISINKRLTLLQTIRPTEILLLLLLVLLLLLLLVLLLLLRKYIE